ncbi:hypothetical protein TNCV_2677691 [Trichonephila clavipes]|nr:hypothetical protein TNCV_2677691 [Trichonephila clavipes]
MSSQVGAAIYVRSYVVKHVDDVIDSRAGVMMSLECPCRRSEARSKSVEVQNPHVGVVRKLGEGVLEQCRPKHLTEIQKYEIHRFLL